MSDRRISLTFVLALSAASAAAAGAVMLASRADLLKPGSLRSLLVHEPVLAKPQDRIIEGDPAKVAREGEGMGQFAQSCKSGLWRRC
jgi:hypothetical protein